MFISIFIGNETPFSIDMDGYGKDILSYGRDEDSDIVIPSKFVSRHHGSFSRDGSKWRIVDNGSTNGLYINGHKVKEQFLSDGLKVYIGPKDNEEKIVLVFSGVNQDKEYKYFPLKGKDRISIGRLSESDICLEHVGISRKHAEIFQKGDAAYIKVYGKNGISFNGEQFISGEKRLQEMDRFQIMDTQFLYRFGELVYFSYKDGYGLTASHIVKDVRRGKNKKRILNDVSFDIQPGEFVAIVGGSGAGKSSLLKCLSCCSNFDFGNVLIQGEDIGAGCENMKQLIGYVPQADIVYDNLTLKDMLFYSAGLRMPQDSSKEERLKRIEEVIEKVELTGHEQTMIGKLSGGQKKRASIAVELLSDPGIFFLDEPTSGLDPGTERNLMYTLKDLSDNGKTVILVTHTPLNIHLCDKILFMGNGGNLCFCGTPAEALEFFKVDNFTDIYNTISGDTLAWKEKYEISSNMDIIGQTNRKTGKRGHKVSVLRQTGILVKRYVRMIWNDKKKLFTQLLMAPGLGLLLYIAFSSSLHPFSVSGDTQTFALALSCCCFWLGLFQSIQEICKERIIVEREKMADLKVGAYLCSKGLVLGLVLLIQCILLIGSVWIFIGHPDKGVLFEDFPFLEYLITTYITALSAAALGLFISGIVGNTDQAVSIAPILLIPQILFSEIICTLSGAARWISYVVGCKWSCLAYGTSALINELPGEYGDSESALWQSGSDVDGFINARYDLEGAAWSLSNPTLFSWLLLLSLSIAFFALSYVAVKRKKEM